MRDEQLADGLKAFGLDEREARVYYHASRIGSARAADLAEAAALKRAEVYRVLEALETKGFIEKTLERPTRFLAVPIEQTLERSLAERSRELDRLSQTRESLIAAWPRETSDLAASTDRFTVHQGRAQIKGLLERMAGQAREELLIVTLRRGLVRMAAMGLLDGIEANPNQPTIRVLTEVDGRNRDTVTSFAEHAQVRHLDLPGYHQMVIVDHREIALFVTLDPTVSTTEGDETVLWLTSRDFILGQEALFDTWWDRGIDHGSRFEEIESGRPAERVEVIRGRWNRFNTLRGMLYRARESLTIAVPGADLARWEKGGHLEALERRADDGVVVRLMTEGELPSTKGIEPHQLASAPPLGVVLVDGQEVLVVLGAGEGPESMAFEGEWSVWATRRPEISQAQAWLASLAPTG